MAECNVPIEVDPYFARVAISVADIALEFITLAEASKSKNASLSDVERIYNQLKLSTQNYKGISEFEKKKRRKDNE